MPELPIQISYEEFTHWVHEVLNHLYDSSYLETHPLVNIFVSEQERNLRPSQVLRRVVLAAIQSFHPEKGVPEHSPDWRTYRILELRYISGMSSAEVMQRLGLGRSLYFMEQARVLESLAELLWQQKISIPELSDYPLEENGELVDIEVQRLLERAAWKEVDVSGLLNDLKPIVERLSENYQVKVNFGLASSIIIRHADRVLMRQVLLNLITMGLEWAHGGELGIASSEKDEQQKITLRAEVAKDRDSKPEISQQPAIKLATCRALLSEMQGELDLNILESGTWLAVLSWNCPHQPLLLLVIDDNQDLVELFRRYLGETAWKVEGAPNGDAARQILSSIRPTAIILDVIMPEEDGWELLLEIKANPQTHITPVIICSALAEPQLARSLGAVSFLPKPVTQTALLNVLRPWSV